MWQALTYALWMKQGRKLTEEGVFLELMVWSWVGWGMEVEEKYKIKQDEHAKYNVSWFKVPQRK